MLERFLTSEDLISLAANKGLLVFSSTAEFPRILFSHAAVLWLALNLARLMDDAELREVILEKGGYYLRTRFFRGRYYRIIDGKFQRVNDEENVRRDIRESLDRYGKKMYCVLLAALKLSKEVGKFKFKDLVSAVDKMCNMKLWPLYHVNYLEKERKLLMKVYETSKYREWMVTPEIWSVAEEELENWIKPAVMKIKPVVSVNGVAKTGLRGHEDIVRILMELGKKLGYEVRKEYFDPKKLYRYDVVWFKSPLVVPRKVFEVQVGGDVDKALVRLKHALDVWNRPDLFLVVTDPRDIERVKRQVEIRLKGGISRA